jgi:sterol desaturase/sphingolipid hydroxylase (fatty acid hydroxylase superfamily)
MPEFRESLLILLTIPIYGLVIGFELFYSHLRKKGLYTAKGIVSNLYLTTLNIGLDILIRGLCLYVLNYFYLRHFIDLSTHPLLYWIVLIIVQDFMFYWLHRVDHYCRLFWAIHVTHHSSEEFNLTIGFRSSVFQPLYRFIYYIPLALMGCKGIDIMFAHSATQIYGILIHTQTIGKLGFLERILVTPSHHRVHHGSNVRYLDKNMGMLLIIWDKLFGTFQAEEETDPVKYGLTTNIKSCDPFNLLFHEWKNMFSDLLKKKAPLKAKFMYVFGPPGWSHDGSTKTSAQLRAELKKQENH